MFYAVFTIIYFRFFSQSKYFTWEFYKVENQKGGNTLGLLFLWRSDGIKQTLCTLSFSTLTLFPRVFLTNLAIPYILVINNAFKYPNRIACV